MEHIFVVVLFFLLGIAGGFLGGLLGVGGGIIFVPLLTHYLRASGVEATVLVKCVLANSLLTIVFTGVAASYNQYKQGTYYLKPVLSVAFAGVASSLATTYLISIGTWYNKERFSLVFISLLIVVSIRAFTKRKINSTNANLDDIKSTQFSIVGFGAGVITALSGLGGGLVMVPALSSILKIDLKKSISISTGVIPFFALPLTIFYMLKQPASFPANVAHIGHVVPQLVVPLGFGVVIASKWGVKVGASISEAKLKVAMLVLIVLVTSKMLWEVLIH